MVSTCCKGYAFCLQSSLFHPGFTSEWKIILRHDPWVSFSWSFAFSTIQWFLNFALVVFLGFRFSYPLPVGRLEPDVCRHLEHLVLSSSSSSTRVTAASYPFFTPQKMAPLSTPLHKPKAQFSHCSHTNISAHLIIPSSRTSQTGYFSLSALSLLDKASSSLPCTYISQFTPESFWSRIYSFLSQAAKVFFKVL